MSLFPPPSSSRPLSSNQLFFINSLTSNNVCSECGAISNLDWASVTYGTVLCPYCASLHRGLGGHLSCIRSLTMDYWTDDQYFRMVRGGNGRWKDYWGTQGQLNDISDFFRRPIPGSISSEQHGVMDVGELTSKIRIKYESNAARAYREALSLAAMTVRLGENCTSLPSVYDTMRSSPMSNPTSTHDTVLRNTVLPAEFPPSLQDLIKEQAWPCTLFMSAFRKYQLCLFAWVVLGISSATYVYRYTCNTSLKDTYSYCNLFALGILALTAGIPYFFIRRYALNIYRSLLASRQDAFKSARNILINRINIGRARKKKRYDVYYPAASVRGELRAKCGFILYPGVLIDRAAYAPIATRLSELGILVVVANFEPYHVLKEEVLHTISNIALSGDQGAWTVDEWTIGGHATGGHFAIAEVENELSSAIKKVVLWGVLSYPQPNTYTSRRTLRELKGVEALVVNGTHDGIIKMYTKDEVATFEAKMPPTNYPSSTDLASREERGHTRYVTIEGGNHAGYAHYRPQTTPVPDGIRTITLEQQQRETAEMTVAFLLSRAVSG